MATGGITFDGSTQYLSYSDKVASSYPFSMMAWVSSSLSGSGAGIVCCQGSSTADALQWIGYEKSNDQKYCSDRSVANGSSTAQKTTTPHISNTSLGLMVGVYTSASSRTIYFGSNTGVTDTGSLTQVFTNLNRVFVAGSQNGGSVSASANATIAECHFFSVALSTSDITTLLTTPPEQVSGWVDGWKLASNTDLTSIGGTRTFSATGSPTTGSLTLPYTRPTSTKAPRSMLLGIG